MPSIKENTELTPGKTYWRSLDQLADTPEFREMVQREFPEGASELNNPVSRRKFLSIMGASMALAGLTSCRRPVEKIIPHVIKPEDVTPGVPKYYASTMPFGNESFGVVVENHDGRPTKIEGNEKHALSAGRSNTWMQAEMLNMYDPDRVQIPRKSGTISNWQAFESAWKQQYDKYLETEGEGLAILSEPFSSPSLRRLKDEFQKTFPRARWVSYAPVSDENITRAVEAATGTTGTIEYAFDKADVVLALDADFLLMETGSIKYSRDFMARRRVSSEKDSMNRLYVAEAAMSITGGMADHRMRLRAGDIGPFAAALANELESQGLDVNIGSAVAPWKDHSFDRKWLQAVAADLIKHKGRSIVLAGRSQPSNVHVLVAAINEALRNRDRTVIYRNNPDSSLSSVDDLKDLTDDMDAGEITGLIILGNNPVYQAPSDLNFEQVLSQVAFTAHLGSHADETAQAVQWLLPQSHFLESWGDVSGNGSRGIVQPLIAPLFNSRSALEMAALIVHGKASSGHDLVRETWAGILPETGFEKAWRKTLHDGVHTNSDEELLKLRYPESIQTYLENNRIFANSGVHEIIFKASASTYDGRYANNGWMQELPDSITKLTWDNAALMSRETAAGLGVKNQDLIELSLDNRNVRLPVWIQPGMADGSIALEIGYGRKHAGRIANGTGVDVNPVRQRDGMDFSTRISVRKLSGSYALACVQDHHGADEELLAQHAIQDRLPELVREATLAEYREHPEFAMGLAEEESLENMWQDVELEGKHQWGMSIDLNACTGCSSCTIACQSENNIPVIGKEEVMNGREMHWLRMDRYYSGDVDDPEVVVQPVGCQHCEMAPCEQVCPVAATTHSEEGLNQMAYNRCVGTRYCANNCPYKVRRFNYFNFTKDLPEIVQMAQNPDVTVRFRGVMEKCTYCVQRIEVGRITAKNEGRELADGDVVSACQQACPTDAIVFGDLKDPESRVSRVKEQNRDYAMLGELNLRPRTSYLAKLRNPNPALEQHT